MKVSQFNEILEQARDVHAAEVALKAYLASFGFSFYCFTYYSGHTKSGKKLRYDYVSDALRPWHNYYIEQTYADADRTLEKSHTDSLPIYWDVQQQLTETKNKREERIRSESIEFGIDKGLSIPVHGSNQDFATLTLHQCRKQTCLTNYHELQFEWLSAAHCFYFHINRLLTLNSQPIFPDKLTKREEQCLQLTAKSWRVDAIAKELKISPRTVNFHLQNVNKKLGTHNKYLAVAKYFDSK